MIGTQLGQYVIERQLGTGAMGVVYRAFDRRLQRAVAIKVFAGLDSPKSRDRLLHEARSASALNHPNICTVYEVGESGDLTYLVMEYVDGQPLASLIPSTGLPVDSVIAYGLQIAAALGHAHERGVVHRDLKSANIVVAAGGQAKVLDFGLALRQLQGTGEPDDATRSMDSMVGPGAMAGTLAYMPPEALRGRPVDARADVWALGVVLYEMAAGRLPFRGQTSFEISGQILHEALAPLPDQVPPTLVAIIERCLAKEPAQRYRDGAETRSALDLASSPRRPVPSAARSSKDTAERHAVLVLPFTSLGTAGEDDWFADGLTEEIIADLSNVRRLRVMSRTSSRQLKGTDQPIAALAAQLGVQSVLAGSVRQNGDQLRVTAQLIDGGTDSTTWAQKYSGSLSDVFAIQERISRSIVDALRVVLTPDEDRRIGQHPIADVRAYEWYLRGKQEMLRFTKEGLDRAVSYLEQSAAIAGENVLLLAAQGEAFWQYINGGLSADLTYLDKAEACARRILEIDPESPPGHRVAGLVSVHRGDVRTAIHELKLALDGNPNDPDSLMWGSLLAALTGRVTLAAEWAARLVGIDPVTPFYQVLPGSIEWMRGDNVAAARLFRMHETSVLEIPVFCLVYGQVLMITGQHADAEVVLNGLAQRLPDNPFGKLAAVYLHAFRGDRAAVQSAFTPDLVAALESDPQYCWFMAQCYALVGDVDEGIRWTAAAADRGFLNHDLLAHADPLLANLRGDPRYVALMTDVEQRMRALAV